MMKVLVTALTFLLATSSLAIDRKKLVSETQEVDDNNGQPMDPNHHHYIPQKHYTPASGEIKITNDNNHHYIGRKDWGKSGQITVNDDGDHHEIRRKDGGESGQVTITDTNDHREIPRKDYDTPGRGQITITDDNDHRYTPRTEFGSHDPDKDEVNA